MILRDKFILEREGGSEVYIEFLDTKSWIKNKLQVSNQITMVGKYKNRYLFKIKDEVEEIEGTSMQLEKNLQNIIEENMEVFLGVKLLATEHSTGKVHNGRIK